VFISQFDVAIRAQSLTEGFSVRQKYEPNCKLYHLPINDSALERLTDVIQLSLPIIHDAICSGKRVIVHCAMGISRSASIVLAYLMAYKSMTFVNAYLYVFQRRPVIRPNHGFFRQLLLFERKLYGSPCRLSYTNVMPNILIRSLMIQQQAQELINSQGAFTLITRQDEMITDG
jgi:protein-tyrosine phosphatase